MGSYRFRRFFLSLLVVFVLFSACSKCYATASPVDFVSQEIINVQNARQNDFLIMCLYPYINNTQAWQSQLKPIFDLIHENDYDVYISNGGSGSIRFYYVILYYSYAPTNSNATTNWISQSDNVSTYTVPGRTFNCIRYRVEFDTSNNTVTVGAIQNNYSYTVPNAILNYKNDMWFDFMQLIYSEYVDYGDILNDIKDFVAHIDINTSVDRYGYILSQIYSVCSIISQNISNYSQDIQDIQDKLDDINDELTAINTYLNNTTLDPNTITNNFPNNSGITSPTDGALANIFAAYQNAFTSTNYTDIVIPLGYVNKSITIPSNYTETFFPSALVTIIQLCYWYVISRWILLYLIKLVNSLRNADFLETRSSSDPKTELL